MTSTGDTDWRYPYDATQYAGGIAASLDKDSSITGCSFTGRATAQFKAGGIVGRSAADVSRCFSLGSVKAMIAGKNVF